MKRSDDNNAAPHAGAALPPSERHAMLRKLLFLVVLAVPAGLLIDLPPAGAQTHPTKDKKAAVKPKATPQAIKNVKVTLVFVGSQWSNMAGRQGDVKGLTQGIVESPFMDMLTTPYGVGRGKVDSQVVLPDKLGATLSDDDIQKKYLTSDKLPAFDASRLYIVFVQPDVVVTAVFSGQPYSTAANPPAGTNSMTGYHGTAVVKSNAVAYAVISYPGGKNLGPSTPDAAVKDALSEITSHEIAEATVGREVADKFNGHYVRMSNGIAVQTIADPDGNPLNPAGSTPISGQAKKKPAHHPAKP
jgi:hypothetical protein